MNRQPIKKSTKNPAVKAQKLSQNRRKSYSGTFPSFNHQNHALHQIYLSFVKPEGEPLLNAAGDVVPEGGRPGKPKARTGEPVGSPPG